MKTKKKIIEEAKANLDHCKRILKANEILWKDRWQSMPNPFVAIQDYRSEKQRNIRKPITEDWLKAQRKYDALEKRDI